MQARLDGHTVLAYTPDARGAGRFTRAMRATLESHARRPLPATPGP
ncbi:hypothetical protein AB0B45_39500 [Nonomuraea sp. NPDC049152]